MQSDRTAQRLIHLILTGAALASACADGTHASSEPADPGSDAVEHGEPNSIEVTALSLSEFDGKTIHFVAGEVHASQTVAQGSAVAMLDEAVQAGTFGQFVYAYFSADDTSDACSDAGPVLSAFVPSADQTGSLIPLTIQPDAFNQLDCKRLARLLPWLELNQDTRPNFHDVMIHAASLAAQKPEPISGPVVAQPQLLFGIWYHQVAMLELHAKALARRLNVAGRRRVIGNAKKVVASATAVLVGDPGHVSDEHKDNLHNIKAAAQSLRDNANEAISFILANSGNTGPGWDPMRLKRLGHEVAEDLAPIQDETWWRHDEL